MTNVVLNQFDFTDTKPNSSIGVFGKRRAGKTTYSKVVLRHLATKIDRFMVMCGTLDGEREWGKVVEPLYVVPKSTSKLEQVRDYQNQKVGLIGDAEIPRKYHLCIVVDDCGADKKFMNSPIMKDLLANARHYGITLLLLMQYMMQLPAECRANLDYVLQLHNPDTKKVKTVYEEYVSCDGFKMFQNVLKSVTSDRGLCVIDNTVSAETLTDHVYWYRLTKKDMALSNMQIGSETVRDFAMVHYNPPGGGRMKRLVTVHEDSDSYSFSDDSDMIFEGDEEEEEEEDGNPESKTIVDGRDNYTIHFGKTKEKLD